MNASVDVSPAKPMVCRWSGLTATIAVLIAVLGAIVVAASGRAQAPSVGTVYAERKPITQTAGFVGRIDAINRVEIRARVQGYLEQVLFKEGAFVKAGDPLYQIQKGPFQAAVQEAQAALDKSKAQKALTAVQLARQELLASQNSTAASTRDEARASDQEAAAAILSNEASLDIAKINLGYTDIVSPISGKISKTNITVGNVVGPDSGPLTVIVSQDPMYVTFPVSQRELLRVRTSAHRVDIKDIKVKIRFVDGSTYSQEGSIDFVDVSVNRSTDTVLVRATMPNPAGLLIDGQLVSVVLEAGQPVEQVVIPQAALIADQQGIYVFVVEDGKAAVKRVKVGAEAGQDVVIEQGLQGGEQVIVEGLQGVRPGQPVQASPMPASLKRS
jgi:membrane fusion protein (multidrug efflux system)